ncbi:hypothetical protein KZ850_33465, partial [Pseudomonas aeruginosa]|nr:hypothetical protein [Pseudomonas aeruginosa]
VHSVPGWSIEIFFFFKQETAYEISECLVGSEMCIRDSHQTYGLKADGPCVLAARASLRYHPIPLRNPART